MQKDIAGCSDCDGSSFSIPRHSSCESLSKRVLDIIGALIGLGITGVLFPWIAAAILLDSPGPVVYVQERIGLGGKRFRMYKFRSMSADAEANKYLVANQYGDGRFFKNRQDPRVTRVGAFLRRTSLDELPQFWNVLVGQMSLVGTRPPLVREVQHYEPHHWQRLAVKPGLTGMWQTSGRSEVQDFEQVVKLDLAYQEHWSLWLDLQLLLRTTQILLSRRGAC